MNFDCVHMIPADAEGIVIYDEAVTVFVDISDEQRNVQYKLHLFLRCQYNYTPEVVND